MFYEVGRLRTEASATNSTQPPVPPTPLQLPSLPPEYTRSLCPALEASMSYHHHPYSRPSSPAPSPPIPTPPSNAKADQIAHRLFNKLVLVVADARATTSNYPNIAQNIYDTNDPSGPNSPSRDSAAVTVALSKRDRAVPRQPKIDKWFNLETPDLEHYKPALATYKSISATYPASTAPPLHISVLLSVPVSGSHSNSVAHHGPNPAKVLVHQFMPPSGASSAMRVTRVTPPPRYILLETHTLTLTPTSMGSSNVELPQVYKQAISLFRSLYTLLRVLPSWKMHRKLRRRGQPGAGNLALEVQVSVGKPLAVDDDLVAGFDAPLSQPPESLTTESISFPSIPTPLGVFAVRTMYRLHPHYALESLESLLSTHFLTPSSSVSEHHRRDDTAALRDPVQFTPTLTSALQRQRQQSLTSPRSPLPVAPPERARPFPIRSDIELTSTRTGTSPLNSLPIRTSLPHSPASQASGSAPIAAPIRNLHSSNSSVSSSSRPRRVSALHPASSPSGSSGLEFPHLPTPPPVGHPLPGSLPGTGASSSPRFGFAHGRDPSDLPFAVGLGSGRTSGTMERTRKESLLSNSGDRMSTGSPHPRRPSINSIHPFKTAPVSSSPSSHSMLLRHNSPLSPQTPSTSSPFVSGPSASTVRGTTGPQTAAEKPISGVSGVSGESGDGSSATAAAVPDVSKRYSSSFRPRHTPGSLGSGGIGTGSDGSGGSAGREVGILGAGGPNIAVEPPTGQTTGDAFLNIPTDDDDISAFVKAIDSRAPLRGGYDTALGDDEDEQEEDEDENPYVHDRASPSRHSNPPSPIAHRRGTVGPSMLTSRAEVDEALRRMTESFRVGVGSLEGGIRARRQRTESAAPTFGGGGALGLGRMVVTEEDLGSSGSGSPGLRGGRLGSNMSSSSLAGGRRSYESDQQIVGPMELADDEENRRVQQRDSVGADSSHAPRGASFARRTKNRREYEY